MTKRIPSQWFWPKVDTSAGPDLCWPWTGECDRKGYGRFSAQRGIRFAHRYSYFLAYGGIPEGMSVLHRCDNPPCVNPGHLFAGTQADNVHDCWAKGRGVSGFALYPERLPRGERHWSFMRPQDRPVGVRTPAAKLNDDAVREIRRRVAAGEVQKDIAAEFGVSKSAVSLIVARKTWGHVK